MNKYDPNKFISNISSKALNGKIPQCQFCGGRNFTSTDKFASILIGEDLDSINIGPSVPAGMLICNNCGHTEFFALGPLGMLKGVDDKNDNK